MVLLAEGPRGGASQRSLQWFHNDFRIARTSSEITGHRNSWDGDDQEQENVPHKVTVKQADIQNALSNFGSIESVSLEQGFGAGLIEFLVKLKDLEAAQKIKAGSLFKRIRYILWNIYIESITEQARLSTSYPCAFPEQSRQLCPELDPAIMAESPFQALLHTNHIPSVSEVQQLTEFCAERIDQLTKIDLELQHQPDDAQAQRLQITRDEIQISLQAHQALLSPICRVPLDVLLQIFVKCLPESGKPLMEAAQAPLLLTHVCKAWREIAIGDPELWKLLHIALPPTTSPYNESMVQAVSEWLSRSGSRPLDILLTECSEFPAEKPTKNAGWEETQFYGAYNYYGGDFNFVDHRKPRQAAPFVKAIVQYATRWRKVTLGLNLDSAGEEGPVEAELKVLQSKDVPLLTDFVYESSGAYRNQREFADEDFNGAWDADPVLPCPPCLAFLREAPMLRALSITISDYVFLPQIQQSQLVQLNLNHMWGASYFVGLRPALLSFLAGCASLEVLVLVGRAEQYMADASTTRDIQVTLKHLDTFSIWMPGAYSRNTSVAELMHSLTLPSLSSLEIKEGGAGYISALEQLLIRSELPPLRTLALYNPASDWGETFPYPRPPLPHLASCLRQIPLLTHLTLYSSVSCPDPTNPTDPLPVLESTFQALTGTSTSRPACPNLEKLTMVRSGRGILRDQSFLDFLERMIIIAPTGKVPLKTVEIQVEPNMDAPSDDQTEALVERLESAGIEIVFSDEMKYVSFDIEVSS
ncbi:hypothetical protein C8J56DRAFT_1029193 [Mycena floridula]|nr:hypothetical protein C8J56DRAFT_1029193 [Mycena floridula]